MSTTHPALQYECFGKFAEGSVSTVYEGFDHDLKRDVIIKELRPEFRGDSEIVETFFAEATLLAGLNHANLLRIYSIDRERYWIVMEPMSRTLDAELKHGNPTFERQREILKQLLEGVRYLHRMGRVHGQIRLDSVLIDQFGQAKLSNLFIADMQDEFRRPDQKQLHTAPEILNPRNFGQPGQRSDLYCIGIVALQMAAGDKFLKLFKGMERKRQQDPMAWSAWHASAEPIGNLRSIVEELPADIEAAIVGLTQKQVESRLATASDALAALTPSMTNGQPVSQPLTDSEDQSLTGGSSDSVIYRGPDLFRPTASRVEPAQPVWSAMLSAQASWRKRLPSKRHLALVGTGLSSAALLAFLALSDGSGANAVKAESVSVELPKALATKPMAEPTEPAKPMKELSCEQKLSIVSADSQATSLKNIRISIDGGQPKNVSSSIFRLKETPGRYLVHVEATDHQPRNVFVELTEGVEGQTTIILDRKKFDVSFSVKPADAKVILRAVGDSEEISVGEPGPETRSMCLTAGTYLVFANADGFQSFQQTVIIDEKRSIDDSIKIDLESLRKVKIWIDSYPQGAQVTVDGKSVGNTPCMCSGTEGTLPNVTISKLGFTEVVTRFRLHPDLEKQNLLWYLDPDPNLLAKRGQGD